MGGDLEIFFTHFKRIALLSFCAIARIPTPIDLCRLTRFIDFLIKKANNRGFPKILGRKKNFFLKKFWFFRFFRHQFFEKNGYITENKFQREKFSKIDIIAINTFWTILNRFRPKKFFRKIFDFLVSNFSKKRLCP